MEKVMDDDSLMTLQESGDEVFRVHAAYQVLGKEKKIEMLQILEKWVDIELNKLR